MAIDRRRFLHALGGAALLGPARLIAGPRGTRLLSCRSDDAGRHFATLLSSEGAVLFDVALPARGHAIALAPDATLAAVAARRPGAFVWLLDLARGHVVARLVAPAERHFYGHSAFSADGRYLYTTENDFAAGRGVIGIYDRLAGWRKTGEFDSHGVGPHELALLADRATLAVANGGLRTHPDTPRAKLNRATMAPNLAYIDAASGRLIERVEPPARWHQLSIRHLAPGPADQLALAMQYEGPPDDDPPLIALHRRGQPLRLLRAPDAIQQRMRHYCGSVAFNAKGSEFAVSSPRGGLVTRWSADGAYLGHHDQPDACGIAAADAGFWISDGTGHLAQTPSHRPPTHFGATHWDNHLLRVTG